MSVSASNGRGSPAWRRFWAALIVFFVGVALLLLAVFGPVIYGETFDGGALKTPAWGMIVVALYVLLGVSIPALLSGRSQDKEDDGG